MTYNGIDQRYYMVNDEDVADRMGGIDEEFHNGDDANLDEYEMVSHIP